MSLTENSHLTNSKQTTEATVESENRQDAPLPRAKRTRRRAKEDKGLPPDNDLKELAREYLTFQRDKWPDLVEAGLIPELTDVTIRSMVNDYKHRHRTGEIDFQQIEPYVARNCHLAGFYGRYSCNNSQSSSNLDQLANSLRKAHGEDHFIPWAFVFCDYSVSGLDSARRGYSSYKKVLKSEESKLETTYIDDFSRASRDSLEWWKLAELSKRLRKDVVGASDGFSLFSPVGEVMMMAYGMLSHLFIKGIQEKVKRGMAGAARRRTCLGKLSVGFTRCPVLDSDGKRVLDSNGNLITRPCIDPVTAPIRLRMFIMFVEQKQSPYKIAKLFNDELVDGWDGWTEATIRKCLWSGTAIGVFIWNRHHREFDFESETWVKVENPHCEWEVYYDPNLGIVPVELWRKARKGIVARRRNRKNKTKVASRNQLCASTLFSGTLHCGYCGRELTLCRSAGKYKNLFCQNGRTHIHGCQLTTTKSTRIIEECILKYVTERLVTEDRLAALVKSANNYLEIERLKPKIDVAPKHKRCREITAKIDKLVKQVEDEADDSLCAGYHRRIKQLQHEQDQLRKELREAETQNQSPPDLLDVDHLRPYLSDIRRLLNSDVPNAAEAIRALTGPIDVRQEPHKNGKRGARWIASFSPNLIELLHQVTQDTDCPDSITLEFLCAGNWIGGQKITFAIESPPKYEELAPEFKRLYDEGASIHEIASKHSVAWRVALEFINFAETGERPAWENDQKQVQYAGWEHFQEIAELVAELRDIKKLNWPDAVSQVTRYCQMLCS
jgi:DNA invertase Pin-like site-specific DNA recombinase